MAGARKKRERQRRTEEFKAAPQSIGQVCAHVANGGTLRGFCIAGDMPFNEVADWIANDDDRNSAYKQALGRRDSHNKDVVVGGSVSIVTADIARAYDPETNTLLPVNEIPEDIRQAIASIKVTELYEGAGEDRRQIGITTEIKLWDRNKSLETLARSLKMLTDKVDVESKVTLEQLVAASNRLPAKDDVI